MVQSFIFLCNTFFWFVRQNKICMKRIKTQKRFRWPGKYLSDGYFFTVLPRALFRTQPKVYGGAFLQKQLINFCYEPSSQKSPNINSWLCFPKTASVACKEKSKLSYKILHNFINSPVFINIKKTLHYKVGIE